MRSDCGTPAPSSSPGNAVAPKLQEIARFTSAVATSVTGIRATRANPTSHGTPIPAGASSEPIAPTKQCRRHEKNRADIAADTEPDVKAAEPQARGGPESDRPLDRGTPFGDQVVARIGDSLCVVRVERSRRRRAARLEHHINDGELRAVRITSQLLDGAAVEIASREIHRAEGAFLAQARIDEAHALEPVGPVDVGDQPHAGDDIANGDVGGTLALLRVLHHLFDRDALQPQPVLQPAQRRHRPRILVPQSLRELRSEGRGQRPGSARGDVRIEFGPRRARHGKPARQSIRVCPRRASDGDLLGQPAQVLDEHDAQRDRHGPQLADRERLHPLVGRDKSPQHDRVEVAVGVRDEGPCQAEHSRITGERPIGQPRQLAVVAWRQVLADFANLLLDQMIVVEQPLGRRYHFPPALQFGRAFAVGREQTRRVGV